jgi:uncharacterized protein HemX
MLKLYMFLFVISILGGVGYSGVWYYNDTQARLTQLRENNIKLEQAAETLQNTINSMEANQARNEELNRELTQKLQKAEEGLNNLRGRFAEIDIRRLARDDPNGLEERINRGVQRLIEKIAIETGAEPTPPADEPATTE